MERLCLNPVKRHPSLCLHTKCMISYVSLWLMVSAKTLSISEESFDLQTTFNANCANMDRSTTSALFDFTWDCVYLMVSCHFLNLLCLCCSPTRSHTSWRSSPPHCSPCPCWGRGWASTSGCPYSSSWLESRLSRYKQPHRLCVVCIFMMNVIWFTHQMFSPDWFNMHF